MDGEQEVSAAWGWVPRLHPNASQQHPDTSRHIPAASRCIPAAFQGRRRHLLPRRRSAPGWDTGDLLGIRSICPESLPQRHAQQPAVPPGIQQLPRAPRVPEPRPGASCQVPGGTL